MFEDAFDDIGLVEERDNAHGGHYAFQRLRLKNEDLIPCKRSQNSYNCSDIENGLIRNDQAADRVHVQPLPAPTVGEAFAASG